MQQHIIEIDRERERDSRQSSSSELSPGQSEIPSQTKLMLIHPPLEQLKRPDIHVDSSSSVAGCVHGNVCMCSLSKSSSVFLEKKKALFLDNKNKRNNHLH